MHFVSPVVKADFDIAYAAHTASCTFLLDADGICRRIVMTPGGKRREASKTAARCIGAQYVAMLDGSVPGCLVEMPKIGATMLFARIDDDGRVALVRTGTLLSFETKRADDPDPFRESVGVMTSAPAAEDLVTAPVRRPVRSEPPPLRAPPRPVARAVPDTYESEPHTMVGRIAPPPATARRHLGAPPYARTPVHGAQTSTKRR